MLWIMFCWFPRLVLVRPIAKLKGGGVSVKDVDTLKRQPMSGLYHEIVYRGRENETDPVIILLHPLGSHSAFWDSCLNLLQGDCPIVVYDRAGAGKTPAPAQPLSQEQCVEELEWVRAHYGFKKIIPIGVATGAMIAGKYAAAFPQFVTALILCNPAEKLSEAGRKLAMERLERLHTEGIAALAPSVVDRGFNHLPKTQAYERFRQQFADLDPWGYECNAMTAFDLDLTADLPRISAPTLVLSGEHDSLFVPESVEAFAGKIPTATFRILKDVAHFPPVQQPEAFAAAVQDYLATHLP